MAELHSNITRGSQDLFVPREGGLCLGKAECIAAQSEVMSFVGTGTKGIPIWLAVTYLSSNVVLNSLNFYWFGKMIETVRKRFEKKPKSEDEAAEEGKGEKPVANGRERKSSIVLDVADGLEKDERLRIMMDGAVEMEGKAGDALSKLNTQQRRDLEDEISDRARTSALESNAECNSTNSYANGSAARKR